MTSTNSADSSWARLLFSAGIFLLGGGVFLMGLAIAVSATAVVLAGGVVASAISDADEVAVSAPPSQCQPEASTVPYQAVTYQAGPSVVPQPCPPVLLPPAEQTPLIENAPPMVQPAADAPSLENSAPTESPE